MTNFAAPVSSKLFKSPLPRAEACRQLSFGKETTAGATAASECKPTFVSLAPGTEYGKGGIRMIYLRFKVLCKVDLILSQMIR